MEHKTVMLDAGSYARLAHAKAELRRRSGLKISFNDVINELVGRNIESLSIDNMLKRYITEFAEKAGSLEYVLGVLLYGSVARNTFGKYSDIDVMVMTKTHSWKQYEELRAIASELEKRHGASLFGRGLPSLISFVILDVDDLKKFRPFHLDLADYGVVLYERGGALRDFIYAMEGIKHWREHINGAEVLRWKT